MKNFILAYLCELSFENIQIRIKEKKKAAYTFTSCISARKSNINGKALYNKPPRNEPIKPTTSAPTKLPGTCFLKRK